MAKVTIDIDEKTLRNLIDLQIKSIQRAINSSDNDEINEIRERQITALTKSLLTINQLELPLKNKV